QRIQRLSGHFSKLHVGSRLKSELEVAERAGSRVAALDSQIRAPVGSEHHVEADGVDEAKPLPRACVDEVVVKVVIAIEAAAHLEDELRKQRAGHPIGKSGSTACEADEI